MGPKPRRPIALLFPDKQKLIAKLETLPKKRQLALEPLRRSKLAKPREPLPLPRKPLMPLLPKPRLMPLPRKPLLPRNLPKPRRPIALLLPDKQKLIAKLETLPKPRRPIALLFPDKQKLIAKLETLPNPWTAQALPDKQKLI